MNKRTGKAHGQIRQSQVVTTFGPGALLDLPRYSVLIGGLDHWKTQGDEIPETRLVQKLKELLGLPSLRLFQPPPDDDNPLTPMTGITAWQFPEWFIAQEIESRERGPGRRSRRLVHRAAPWAVATALAPGSVPLPKSPAVSRADCWYARPATPISPRY